MNKRQRWTWFGALVALTGVALVLGFVLSFGTEEGRLYERQFVWIFWTNVAVAVLLALAVLIAAVRLVIRLHRRKFGSKLLLKLAGIFALVGLVPGLLIYTVSYQFVSRSIEVWFDVKVAGALDAGLGLGRSTVDGLLASTADKARTGAERIAAEARDVSAPLALERLREQLGVDEAALLGPAGQPLFSVGAGGLAPAERAPALLLRRAQAEGSAAVVEGLDEETVAGPAPSATRVRAIARVPAVTFQGLALASDERFLLVVQTIPRTLARNALAVQGAYSEYQQRALARDSLARLYIGTLTLALVLSVFGAVLMAALLGIQLVRPLLLLADGVQQVAAGDLTPKPVFTSSDELGGLTRSFAQMTAQLADARAQVDRGVTQLEGARQRLQTILDTLSAGVIVFDREGRIDIVNPGAARILGLPMTMWRGQPLAAVPELEGFAASVEQRYQVLVEAQAERARGIAGAGDGARESMESDESDHWQEAHELLRGDGSRLTLLARGAMLPGEQRLLVFDDITEVVSAQRQQAWAEVARRLAHEIKNPLTPIQLSAERLEAKLGPKLANEADRRLLVRSVETIVAQVQGMLALVNEFRDYARLPSAQMKPLDLNELVADVLALYGQEQESGRLAARLAADAPRIRGDASQLRQVIHNLVQNAFDAVDDRPEGRVEISTRVVRGDMGELRALRLAVQDNGPGFADKVLKNAFEPYVTTKAKGTGLGLAVVRKIADEHGARVRAANVYAEDLPEGPALGARVSLSFSSFA